MYVAGSAVGDGPNSRAIIIDIICDPSAGVGKPERAFEWLTLTYRSKRSYKHNIGFEQCSARMCFKLFLLQMPSHENYIVNNECPQLQKCHQNIIGLEREAASIIDHEFS